MNIHNLNAFMSGSYLCLTYAKDNSALYSE